MKEVLRVFNKRTLMLLAILCFINTSILILCADPAKHITLMGEEQELYLQEYPQFLERTLANGRTMSLLNVYRSGFAQEQIQKVTARYQALENIQVASGNNRGLVLFIQYSLTDIFLVAFLFLIVMSFFAERKKGLVYIVRSTIHGRGVLFLQRLTILICATLLGGILLYSTAFAGVHFSFGINGLSRSIQSLPEFMKCTYPITIGEYLFYSCLIKLSGCLLAAIFLYVILGIFSPLAGYTIAGFLVVAEIVFAFLIEPVSSLNLLRYLNILTLIRTESYFTDCIYLNLFGNAVPALELCLLLLLILFVVLAVFGFFVHGKMYVTVKRGLESFLEKIYIFLERHAPQRTTTGWETYKLFIKQGALLLLFVMLVLQTHLSFRYQYYYPVNAMERLYYMEFEGEITKELLETVEHKMIMLKESAANMQKTLDKLWNSVPLNDYLYGLTSDYLTNNLAMQRGLEPVLLNIREGFAYTQKTGKPVELIQPYTYDLLINRDTQVKQRASFLVLIVIIGALSGVYAYDHQNHMQQIMHTTYRGRQVNHIRKPLIGIGFCALTAILLHGVQLIHIQIGMGFNNLSAPIQSLTFMRHFPLYLSIGGYLLVLFLLRLLATTGLGILCMSLSHICQDKFTALGLGAFLCMLFFSLSELIPGADFLNPIYILSGNYFK
ncbi:MAG: hypothetical protein IKK33_11675 [Lachnospiraceae bacterium]|nr:hypothetical protein [Lachnospiraceae bacterium]